VWHRIQEGQTLWRIAKTYRVTLENIKEANDLNDVVHIAQGTWIFIPGTTRVMYVQGNITGSADNIESMDFQWPVTGEVVKHFGKHHDDFNYGIDVQVKGTQNVVASQRGVVVLANTIRGYGNTIIIEHDNNFCSLYATNIISLVNEGQEVEMNTVIAKTSTTRGSGREVVHYELFFKGKPVNPLYYLP
jgi:septal ring factor EnvC (AmiA/AmiB activator)